MTNVNLPSMLEEAEIRAQKDAIGEVDHRVFIEDLYSREKLGRDKALESNQDIIYLKKQIEKIEEKHTQFELKKKEWEVKEVNSIRITLKEI